MHANIVKSRSWRPPRLLPVITSSHRHYRVPRPPPHPNKACTRRRRSISTHRRRVRRAEPDCRRGVLAPRDAAIVLCRARAHAVRSRPSINKSPLAKPSACCSPLQPLWAVLQVGGGTILWCVYRCGKLLRTAISSWRRPGV